MEERRECEPGGDGPEEGTERLRSKGVDDLEACEVGEARRHSARRAGLTGAGIVATGREPELPVCAEAGGIRIDRKGECEHGRSAEQDQYEEGRLGRSGMSARVAQRSVIPMRRACRSCP